MSGAIAAQVRAAEPGNSSWVSANAGSGKTRVLTDRVARLLLAETPPQKILCLTYTKAAATEMQNRLFRTLGAWAMLPDAELRAALGELGAPQPLTEAPQLNAARTLFARALETPGGLKIQTIHAFCETLLRRFPLEAGVSPQFAVLEDRQAEVMRREVLEAVAIGEPALFADMARHLSGDDPDPLLREVDHHRSAFARPADPAALARAFGITPGVTLADLHARAVGPDGERLLDTLAAIMAKSGRQDAKDASAILTALRSEGPAAKLIGLEGVCLTKSGNAPFTARISNMPTKAVAKAHPELTENLDALMSRVEEIRPQRLALAAFERTRALHAFARAYLAAFTARKQAEGWLDFTDLIDGAHALLKDRETAAWVLWRLDGGIDHILVDEAQDTSPAQWDVIDALSAEFFSGRGARALVRTIFVVGDEKQSIYSFQGADPVAFADMRGHFTRLLGDMGDALERCDLLYSFRSAAPVLALVDAVFAGPAGARLGPDIRHHPIYPDRPGRVEVWPFLPKPETPEEGPWDAPVDALPPDDPITVLAGRIAATVAGWIAQGRILPGEEPRPIAAGDVLILVQRRKEMFHAVIRALKREGVPVAGADRLTLSDELAVKDLLAALRVAATPGDDLSLAAFLRSPLGGLGERDLFDLAHGRTGSLWDALRLSPDPRWAAPRALLSDLMSVGDYLRPFEILTRLLVRHDGRRRLVARLGIEVEDGIDALLDQALDYERVQAPSLTGFLGWIDRGELTIKRRVDAARDEVRVMTVHGAKGLEAPIVILPDTAARKDGANPPQILRDGDGPALWKTAADQMPACVRSAEDARRARVGAENRRLLYVAMTRAKSWLIVCGAGTQSKTDPSWHDQVAAAIETLDPERVPAPEGLRLTLSHRWTDAAAGPAPARPAAPAPAGPLPQMPPAPVLARTLAPSALGGAHVLADEAADPALDEIARLRGSAIHALLEALPERDPSDWPALAARLIRDAGLRDAALAEAGAVILHRDLAAIFADDALSEVDIGAPLSALDGAHLSGRIDRLLVSTGTVRAVDFKSNRIVPAAPDAVPEGILRQMGAYAAALGAIWPGRRIETAVLWTRTATLMPLPAALTQAALVRAARDPARRGIMAAPRA